jgi:hypothetical protein
MQEAAERLFRELLNESSLRHLWPQIVRVSHEKHRAVGIISRYLSRFSSDLKTRAKNALEKDAAKFVLESRLTVAERIVESNINELRFQTEWACIGPDDDFEDLFTWTLKPNNEGIRFTVSELLEWIEDLDRLERDIVYEHVQQFILEGAPFQSFVSAVKLFVSKDSDTAAKITTSIRQSFNYVALRNWRSPKLDHQIRISWSCVSSTNLSCDTTFPNR